MEPAEKQLILPASKKIAVYYRSPQPVSDFFPVPTDKHYRFRHRFGLEANELKEYVNFPSMGGTEAPDWGRRSDRLLFRGPYEAIWDRGNKGPPFQFGGPMVMSKVWLYFPDLDQKLGPSPDNAPHFYQGPAIPHFPGLELFVRASDYRNTLSDDEVIRLHDIDPLYVEDLTSYGPTAWERFKPTHKTADFGQLIVEARDLTRLLHFKFKSVKDLGSNHLNVEFGWKPLISDLKKMLQMYDTLHKVIAQLIRDNNRGIRRKGVIGNSTDSSGPTVVKTGRSEKLLYPSAYSGTPNWLERLPDGEGLYTPYSVCLLDPNQGGNSDPYELEMTESVETTEQIRFSGRFRYYIEDPRDPDWYWRAIRETLGLTPNFSLLWEVIPWSWLIDWFSNIGDVLSNAEDRVVDRLTADYAFIIGEKHITKTYKVRAQWDPSEGSPTQVRDFIVQRHQVLKVRREASPYGFGLTIGDLSYRQFGILAALALQRSKLS